MRSPYPQKLLAAAFALVVLLAAPTTAPGGTKSALSFRFEGSNGYAIGVSGRGATVFITATRPSPPSSDSKASSTYIARGKVSATALRARFGDMGSVAVRFHPSDRVAHSKPQRGCRGPDRQTIRFGVFTGSARFRGEYGYTSASVHRAKGKVITPPSPNCSSPPIETSRRKSPRASPGKGHTRTTLLSAASRSPFTAIDFIALEGRSKVAFEASIRQSVGSLAIFRTASAVAPAHTFASDSALSFVSVTPPAPFSGTGSMQRNDEGVRIWSGSLDASFPGAPAVPLAGPQFKTQLIRSW